VYVRSRQVSAPGAALLLPGSADGKDKTCVMDVL
jgi:hypothetical protein